MKVVGFYGRAYLGQKPAGRIPLSPWMSVKIRGESQSPRHSVQSPRHSVHKNVKNADVAGETRDFPCFFLEKRWRILQTHDGSMGQTVYLHT